MPVIQLDYHFLNDDGKEIANEAGDTETLSDLYSTTLAAVDCDTATPLQLSLPAKGGNSEYAAASMESFVKRLGHERVRIR